MSNRAVKHKSDRTYLKAFGQRVKETRQKREWAQGDLAAVSGVSDGQISAIENGRESPRLDTIKAIALALGMSPSDLLDFPFEFKLNTNFKKGKIRKSGTMQAVRGLLDLGFFKKPRTVSEVVQQCKTQFDINLQSAETSGAMLLLVDRLQLKKIKEGRNKNSYQAVR